MSMETFEWSKTSVMRQMWELFDCKVAVANSLITSRVAYTVRQGGKLRAFRGDTRDLFALRAEVLRYVMGLKDEDV